MWVEEKICDGWGVKTQCSEWLAYERVSKQRFIWNLSSQIAEKAQMKFSKEVLYFFKSL